MHSSDRRHEETCQLEALQKGQVGLVWVGRSCGWSISDFYCFQTPLSTPPLQAQSTLFLAPTGQLADCQSEHRLGVSTFNSHNSLRSGDITIPLIRKLHQEELK